MGSNPFCYFTPFDADFHSALQQLRLREFEAGRYDPALRAANPPTYTFMQQFPPGPDFPSPGPQHASIDAAISAAGEGGTGSILDIVAISVRPMMSFAYPLNDVEIRSFLGSATPSASMVSDLILNPTELRRMSNNDRSARIQRALPFWDSIDRGQARILIVYDEGARMPEQLFFAGMTID